MDFSTLRIGSRGYYTTNRQVKEYGRVIKTTSYDFTVKFDNEWDRGLYLVNGRRDIYVFTSLATFKLLHNDFSIDDIVYLTTGPYRGASGLVYAYEGEVVMVDVEHNAVACQSKDLELVARKRLI